MAVHVDTSVLVAALGEAGAVLDDLERLVRAGERLAVSTLVLYEWARGPRTPGQVAAQRRLFGASAPVPFGEEEALVAADVYRRLGRPRRREVDIAIAACALVHGAPLWTLNREDFADIPGLTLV